MIFAVGDHVAHGTYFKSDLYPFCKKRVYMRRESHLRR